MERAIAGASTPVAEVRRRTAADQGELLLLDRRCVQNGAGDLPIFYALPADSPLLVNWEEIEN